MYTSKDNDDLLFAQKNNTPTTEKCETKDTSPLKIMIIDDDDVIHDVSRLVLSGLSFEGRPLQIIDGYSAKEAINLLNDTPDIALILLDVVMETEQAGLTVVKHIRETLNNQLVRIILRTGQPGDAPEEDIILNYDINDYKEKTELTARKLHTSVITSLRSYLNLKKLINNQKPAYDNDARTRIESLVNESKTLHKANQALTREISSYAQAQELVNIGHWELFNETQELIISKHARMLLDIKKSIGNCTIETILDGISDENRTTEKTIRQAITEKTDFDIQHDIVNKSGEKTRIHHLGRSVYDKDTNRYRFIATLYPA